MRRAAVLAAGALLALPAVASAGGPGTWTRVTPTTGINIDQVTLLRTPDGVLHVAWLAKNAADATTEDLATAPVSPAGAVGAPVAIETGWASLSNPALAAAPGGGLRIFFGGIRSLDPNETQTNLSTSSAPQAGAPWTLQGGNVAEGGAAYSSPVSAAALTDGTPLVSWASGSGVFVHRGLAPGSGDPDLQQPLGGCCGYDSGLGVDGSTGTPFVAWYSNATNHDGVFAEQIDPASGGPAAPAILMPGSVTAGNSSPQLARTPVAGRPGRPGVYVAYPGGYPTQTRVLVWKIGTPTSATLANEPGDHRDVTLAAAPDGRLWVLWGRQVGGRPRVFARRSNPDVSLFGATVSVSAPKGAETIWKLDASAQAGVADVLGSFTTAGSLATWHTQIRPGLTLQARRAGHKVHVRVLDAGAGVAGASVRAAGHSATTSASGRATLTPVTKNGRVTVTAGKPGYTSATARAG